MVQAKPFHGVRDHHNVLELAAIALVLASRQPQQLGGHPCQVPVSAAENSSLSGFSGIRALEAHTSPAEVDVSLLLALGIPAINGCSVGTTAGLTAFVEDLV